MPSIVGLYPSLLGSPFGAGLPSAAPSSLGSTFHRAFVVGLCLPLLGYNLRRWALSLWHLLRQRGGPSSSFNPFSPIFRGIADSRLVCDNPSSMTFSTWRQARSYYNVCFMDGSVAIRSPQTQNPVQSPAHKRQKIAASPMPISRQYTPLSFPSSPEAPPLQSGNNLTHRRIVVVEDSSDENPSANDTAPTISLPGPSSSAGSVIIVSDSEEEEEGVTMPAGCFTIDDDTLRRELQIIADYHRKLAEYRRGP